MGVESGWAAAWRALRAEVRRLERVVLPEGVLGVVGKKEKGGCT